MENSEINESFFNKNILSEENVIRCPKCYLIPFISINYSNEQIFLNFKCLNNHLINKPLKELYYESKKYQINSIKCKKKKKKDKLYYCIKCYGFYCEKEIHSLEEGHNILIPVKKKNIIIIMLIHFVLLIIKIFVIIVNKMNIKEIKLKDLNF